MATSNRARGRAEHPGSLAMSTIFVGVPLSERELAVIRTAAPQTTIKYFGDANRAALEDAIPEADVILGRGDAATISPSALARAHRLRWVHTWAAGPNEMLDPEMVASPVVVTSSTGSGAVGMAEHAVMLMLMLNRGALDWVRAQDQHRWERHVHPELNGLTCGIIGLGNSGQDLALKLAAFHMHVLGMRRVPRPTPSVAEVFGRDGLQELLGRSDFVVVTAPLTPETTDMLGDAELRTMKPSAYLICSSRGGIVNEAALLRALTAGRIAGAGLDAFYEEPLRPDSPFWGAPNTIVTPHIGALTPRRMQASLDMFVANLRRYVDGKPLEHVVDKQAGY